MGGWVGSADVCIDIVNTAVMVEGHSANSSVSFSSYTIAKMSETLIMNKEQKCMSDSSGGQEVTGQWARSFRVQRRLVSAPKVAAWFLPSRKGTGASILCPLVRSSPRIVFKRALMPFVRQLLHALITSHGLHL